MCFWGKTSLKDYDPLDNTFWVGGVSVIFIGPAIYERLSGNPQQAGIRLILDQKFEGFNF